MVKYKCLQWFDCKKWKRNNKGLGNLMYQLMEFWLMFQLKCYYTKKKLSYDILIKKREMVKKEKEAVKNSVPIKG